MGNETKAFTSNVGIEIAKDFREIALSLNKKPAVLIRELIIGVVEDRVKIAPRSTDASFHSNLYS